LIGVVLLWQLLARPRWWMAPAAGVVLAAAYILKSSVIPLIAAFLACAALLAVGQLWRALQRRQGADGGDGAGHESLSASGWATLVRALIVPLVFGAILFPYFRNTARMHGSPFWDVHSKHYMWMDGDEQKRFWRDAGISNAGFVPPEGHEVPSAMPYLRSHSLGEMAARLDQGWRDVVIKVKARYRGAYTVIKKWCLPALLVLGIVFWRRAWHSLRTQPVVWLFLAGLFVGYGILYAWYQAIGAGPRLILALFLPALFFATVAIYRLTEGKTLAFRGRTLSLRHAINAVALAVISIQSILLLTGDYWTVEGGR
ncbi:MAG: hypothetical protein KDM64_11785, partial [Verrucomicrobiae bacterium]|nr:hypothetical protein [Verrucomicrobiae bacterium]